MAEPRRVQRCQFAEPTLFLANPFWTAAEDYPWSCHADGVPRPVEDTAECSGCSRWVSRDPRMAEQPGPFGRR
jgi:hypothetical protein